MADIGDWVRDRGISEVECLVPDMNGVLRGKVFPAAKLVQFSRNNALRLPSSVFSVTVVTLIWRLLLRPETGALAAGLQGAGLPMASPLHSEWLALPTVAVMTLWWGVGLPMMLFLAALQQIPGDVYEAAALDNAGPWARLRHITLPALQRVLVLVAITQVIAQLQVFGQVQLLTEGGPNHSTRSLVMVVFEAMFDQWQLGYAAAASQLLTLLLLACLALQQRVARGDDAGRRTAQHAPGAAA